MQVIKMNKYIKINTNNEIIDVFFECQDKFDGTEILIGDLPKTHKINDKSISDEYGTFIFTWSGSEAIEKDAAEVEQASLGKYKAQKRDALFTLIMGSLLSTSRTLQELQDQWPAFAAAAIAAETKQEIDTLFNNAVNWL